MLVMSEENTVFCSFSTKVGEDGICYIKVKKSRALAPLAFSTCSETIKVYAAGLQRCINTSGLRLNVHPSEMKAKSCRGEKIEEGNFR